ncbi:hypothetical protein LJC27_02515 [Christensenellaceae bacterium OttesenSCG-928-M15]|nr:hypothetical protein [Christensenellaceae bacterium OttesenSCG-928-M15]
MAKITSDEARMKQAATQLETLHQSMLSNISKMSELVQSTKKVWQDDNAATFIKNYEKREGSLRAVANAAQSCATILSGITDGYTKADTAAMDAIKSTMGGRR